MLCWGVMLGFNINTQIKALRGLSESDKQFCFEVMSHITSNLDLTQTQLDKLRTAYRAIGSYLASKGGWLSECHVYAQGSVGIGTSVKPIDESSDMDIDLVLHLPSQTYPTTTYEANQLLCQLINELQDSPRYKDKVENEPKRRCVTMQYKGEGNQGFHLDITPTMPEDMNLPGREDDVRVADIHTANSPSHPFGYRAWFRGVCSKQVRWSRKSIYKTDGEIRAGTVEELPGQVRKTVLQIIVQLLKRHRDLWKNKESNVSKEFAPISIIITTLSGRAYDKCANSGKEYDNPFDLMLDVLELIPSFIGSERLSDGSIEYSIPNPALPTENFADKWREKPSLAHGFKDWYECALIDITTLLESDKGMDKTVLSVTTMFGNQASRGLASKLASTLTSRRIMGQAVVTASGLGLSNSSKAQRVPDHNFYGDSN